MYFEHEIECYLYTSEGDKIDISRFVVEFEYADSLKLQIPFAKVSFSKAIIQQLQLMSNHIDHFEVTVKTGVKEDKQTCSAHIIDHYILDPTTHLWDMIFSHPNKQEPEIPSIVSTNLAVRPVVTYAGKLIGPKIKFNIQPSAIVDCAIKKQGALVKQNKLSTQPIDQIIIPQSTIQENLAYFDYWFSFTKGFNPTKINYNIEKKKAEVCLTDVDYAFKTNQYDVKFYFTGPCEDVTCKLIKDVVSDRKLFLSPYPFKVENSIGRLVYKNYQSIAKPKKILYKNFKTCLKDSLIYYRNPKLSKDHMKPAANLRRQLTINNHTGNNCPIDPFLSKIQGVNIFGSRITATMKMVPSLQNLYPGYIANVNILDMNKVALTGLYLIEGHSTVYRRISTVSWYSVSNVSLIRSNTTWI